MTLPNFSNINSELSAQGNKIKDNYNNKEVLLEISDTLIKMQKEIMYALQNLGYENMPTVKVDMDGVNTKITDATGDIVKIKQSGHEMKQSIESERIRVDGEVKRLSEVIDEKTGKLSKDLEGKVIELTNAISEVKQTADNIKLEVKETTTAFEGKINDVEGLLDEKTNKLNSDLQGKIREVSDKVSTIDQKADGIKMEVSDTVRTFESKTKELDNSIKDKTEAISRNLNNKISSVTTNVSKIDQKADRIELSVSKKVDRSDFTGREMISKINMDSSSMRISSNKLVLESTRNILTSPNGRIELELVDTDSYGRVGNPYLRLRARQDNYGAWSQVIRVEHAGRASGDNRYQPEIQIGNRNPYGTNSQKYAPVTRLNLQGVNIMGRYYKSSPELDSISDL